MTTVEFKSLVKWMEGIGITTLKDFILWKNQVTDGTDRDVLNKANGCFVHGVTFDLENEENDFTRIL